MIALKDVLRRTRGRPVPRVGIAVLQGRKQHALGMLDACLIIG